MPRMNKGGKLIFGKSLIRDDLPILMLSCLQLSPGMELLSIRSSFIAFTMGAKWPLLKREAEYNGEIEVF